MYVNGSMMSRTFSQTEEHKQKHSKRRRKRKLEAKIATTDVPTKNSELPRIKQLAKTYITNMQFNKRPPAEPRLKDRITKRTDPSRKSRGHRGRKRNLYL